MYGHLSFVQNEVTLPNQYAQLLSRIDLFFQSINCGDWPTFKAY